LGVAEKRLITLLTPWKEGDGVLNNINLQAGAQRVLFAILEIGAVAVLVPAVEITVVVLRRAVLNLEKFSVKFSQI
jgi:hypothetical protein